MKKIVIIMTQDIMNAVKDNILLFSLLGPIIVAIGIRLFLPSMDSIDFSLAVGPNIPEEVVEKLSSIGNIRVYSTRQLVEERVNKSDLVTGIVYENSQYILLFEGNEIPSLMNSISSLINRIIFPQKNFYFDIEALSPASNFSKKQLTIIMVLVGTLMGGMIVGFHMVEDKETKTISALSVSPLRYSDYIIARGLSAGLMGAVISLLSVIIIFGVSFDWFKFLISLVLSTFISFSFSFFLAAYATNQIIAIGLVKILLPVYLSVPVISLVIPQAYLWGLIIFPNFWFYVILQNIFDYTGKHFLSFWPATAFFCLTSLILNATLIFFNKKRVGFR